MTSTPTRPVDNVVIATKGLQDRNTNITAGTTVENEGKLILSKNLKFKKYKTILPVVLYGCEAWNETFEEALA